MQTVNEILVILRQ